MLFEHNISAQSFKTWLLQDRENRRMFWIALCLIIVQFVIFKFLYPYPNFMPPDSANYLEAASSNQFIAIWPIGYSKFLRLFSCFTNSHLVLVWFQYILVQASLIYFLFTFRYLLLPGKWLFRILLVCCVINPLLPHIGNFVSSDALFLGLSLTWFTQILWLIYHPTKKLLVWHSIILLLAFMVRYYGIFYPLISASVILFNSRLRLNAKAFGIGLFVLLLCSFIGRTQYEYDKLCGKVEFSPFGGWQIAANALYGYAHAKTIPASQVPAIFRPLHELVNSHNDALRQMPDFLRPDNDIGIYYLWNKKSPLKQFIKKEWKNDTASSYLKKWAFIAPVYSDYGWYLIRQYPGSFMKYYVFRNFIKFYAPPVGFMGYYNIGQPTVDATTVDWFNWKSNKINNFFKDKEIEIANIFQIGAAIINVLFLISLICFAFLGGFKYCNPNCKQILVWTAIFWFSNMLFSIWSAPIELRYQLFPMILSFCFSLNFIAFIVAQTRKDSVKALTPKSYDRAISESLI